MLLPDLAMTAALASLVILLARGHGALLADADAGWHIRSGERILATRSLPVIDPFSFSKGGQPWVAWEWGADMVSGVVHRLAGLRGVVFLYACAIAASVWQWVRLSWAAGGNFLLTAVFAVPFLNTLDLHWLARPHIFGWLFATGVSLVCEKRQRVPPAAAFALGMLWANVHASFLLGPLVALIYRRYVLAAALFAGTFLNPYGWHLHGHVIFFLTDAALLARIAEFQSFSFAKSGGWMVTVSLFIGMAGGVASLVARRFDRFLMAALFSLGALRSVRMIPVAALLLLPLANGSLARLVDFAYLRRLRALDIRCGGWAWAPAAAVLLFGVLSPTFPPDQFPVAASAYVQTLPAHARVFSSDKFGGYLIYRFEGRRKVFFDGRSDFYGAEFLKSYGRMVQTRPGWRDEFAAWQFTHALLAPDMALTGALQAAGWKTLYRDSTAILLEARG